MTRASTTKPSKFTGHSSPAAAIEWLRVLRETEARLIEWTARTGCTPSEHRDDPVRGRRTDEAGWQLFVDADAERRSRVLIDAAVQDGDPAVQAG